MVDRHIKGLRVAPRMGQGRIVVVPGSVELALLGGPIAPPPFFSLAILLESNASRSMIIQPPTLDM